MGMYLNPGNSGFEMILNDEYIDKTGLIDLINQSINTPRMLTCISRPRRFGKSFAAKMLCAYYDCSCDSRPLFDDKAISKSSGYLVHLNKYHVINLDITTFISTALIEGKALKDIPTMIGEKILADLREAFPDIIFENDLTESLIRCVEKTGKKFIFIIDEWGALIREAKNEEITQKRYLNVLRMWFKNNNFTPKVIAAAYMTGILPIKKDGSQSAISDFLEYSILDPGKFAEYTGFTESEVRALCAKYQMHFEEAKKWYDGYDFSEVGAIYNPYSVMQAVRNKKFGSYWQKTSAAESLMTYVNMDFQGLQEIITRLIAGEEVEVRTDWFENDFESFRSKDDILTLLIHLGYLTWNQEEKVARIPNEEVRLEFEKILAGVHVNAKWTELIRKSQNLLEKTIAGKDDEVAEAIEEVRNSQYAPTFYNDEQALRYVIKFAYIVAVDQYMKIEELPSGKGIADIVYLPKKKSMLPALVIELKWNKTSDGAIDQIHEKNYPAVLRDFGGEIVLVGINYDQRTKQHTCKIERILRV